MSQLILSPIVGMTAVSKEIENNAYAKFWRANKVHYGKCGSGVCHNKRNRDSLVKCLSFGKLYYLYLYEYWRY